MSLTIAAYDLVRNLSKDMRKRRVFPFVKLLPDSSAWIVPRGIVTGPNFNDKTGAASVVWIPKPRRGLAILIEPEVFVDHLCLTDSVCEVRLPRDAEA